MKCPSYTSPDSIPLDLSSISPYIIGTATLRNCMFLSHLPRLLHQKYGKCYVLCPATGEKVTKDVFNGNPYVTKMIPMINTLTVPTLAPTSRSDNIIDEWTRMYGLLPNLSQVSRDKPELYLDSNEIDSTVYDEIFADPNRYRVFLFFKDGHFLDRLRYPALFKSIKDYFCNINKQVDFIQAGSCDMDLGDTVRILKSHNNVRSLMHIIRRCDLYVGNARSGAYYIAVALDKKCLILENNYHYEFLNMFQCGCSTNSKFYQTHLKSYECTCKDIKVVTLDEFKDIVTDEIYNNLQ
jgi:hypothetical protein